MSKPAIQQQVETATPVSAPDWKAIAAATTTVLLWASAFVAIRSAGAEFAPGALALGRLLTGAIVLLIIWAVRGEGFPKRAAWPGIIVSGLLWFGVYMVVLNWGEQLLDAGTSAMVVNIGPVLIAVLGGWLLREGFTSRLLIGLGVAFAGAIVVGLASTNSTVTSEGANASLGGVLLCALAAVGYAGGVIGQKTALRHSSALSVTTFGCLIGAVGCLPFSGQLITQLGTVSTGATLNMLYLGVFPTALAFTTWAYALSRTTAGKMGSTTYAVPAVVILLSWALLGELPAWLSLLGGVLCLTGVAISRSRKRSRILQEDAS